MVGSLTVASVGTILIGVGTFTPQGLSAALFYLLHSTLIAAAMFLLAEQIAAQRGHSGDRLLPAAAVRDRTLLGLLMLLTAAWAAGIPPLPGFMGKIMLLSGTAEHVKQPWIWFVVLGVGFLTLLGLARAGVTLFWHVDARVGPHTAQDESSPRTLSAIGLLWVFGLTLIVFASPVKRYIDEAVVQMGDRDHYANAVLGQDSRPGLLRPYDGRKPEAPRSHAKGGQD